MYILYNLNIIIQQTYKNTQHDCSAIVLHEEALTFKTIQSLLE